MVCVLGSVGLEGVLLGWFAWVFSSLPTFFGGVERNYIRIDLGFIKVHVLSSMGWYVFRMDI